MTNKIAAIPNPTLWSQQEDEEPLDYRAFLYYLNITPPTERNFLTSYRNWLVDNKVIERGESLGRHIDGLKMWRKKGQIHDWIRRARAYDIEVNKNMINTLDEIRREQLQEMAQRHIEGAQRLWDIALRTFYKRDDKGNILHDEQGNPITRPIDSDAAAVKAAKVAVDIERTARGQPAYIAVMTTEQIQRRILEIQNRWRLSDDDVSDSDTDIEDEDDDPLMLESGDDVIDG